MNAIAIIPARYQSTRLPGKPLAEIGGKPMIQHVYENVAKSREISEVIVATDDERVVRAVEAFGGEARMTSPAHATGTDRVAEVAAGLDATIVVNVQGDEPFITPGMISEAVLPLIEDPELQMSTLMHEIGEEGFADPSVVKVVVDLRGNALYFSRSLLPFPRVRDSLHVFEHIGIYCYRSSFLSTFVALPQSPLEKTESLEQLRALENGYTIRVVRTSAADYIPLSIDTNEDLQRARRLYLQRR